jgi:hypothetical protein
LAQRGPDNQKPSKPAGKFAPYQGGEHIHHRRPRSSGPLYFPNYRRLHRPWGMRSEDIPAIRFTSGLRATRRPTDDLPQGTCCDAMMRSGMR